MKTDGVVDENVTKMSAYMTKNVGKTQMEDSQSIMNTTTDKGIPSKWNFDHNDFLAASTFIISIHFGIDILRLLNK